jgi:hypothetical protein
VAGGGGVVAFVAVEASSVLVRFTLTEQPTPATLTLKVSSQEIQGECLQTYHCLGFIRG